MLEFYQAYTDYQGLMDFTSEFLKQTAIDATGSAVVEWQGHTLDFANIRRVPCKKRWALKCRCRGTPWWRHSREPWSARSSNPPSSTTTR